MTGPAENFELRTTATAIVARADRSINGTMIFFALREYRSNAGVCFGLSSMGIADALIGSAYSGGSATLASESPSVLASTKVAEL